MSFHSVLSSTYLLGALRGRQVEIRACASVCWVFVLEISHKESDGLFFGNKEGAISLSQTVSSPQNLCRSSFPYGASLCMLSLCATHTHARTHKHINTHAHTLKLTHTMCHHAKMWCIGKLISCYCSALRAENCCHFASIDNALHPSHSLCEFRFEHHTVPTWLHYVCICLCGGRLLDR